MKKMIMSSAACGLLAGTLGASFDANGEPVPGPVEECTLVAP